MGEAEGGVSDLVLWVDECLGTREVPTRLRERGFQVVTHRELYEERRAVPDVEWIPEVTRRGWVILTQDRRIARQGAELDALIRVGARFVALASAGARASEQVEVLLEHWPTIESALRRPPPVILKVTRSAVERFNGQGWHRLKRRRARRGSPRRRKA